MPDGCGPSDRDRLTAAVVAGLPTRLTDPAEFAGQVVDLCCSRWDEGPAVTSDPGLHVFTMPHVPTGEGASYKLRNVMVNWRKLFSTLSCIVVTGVGAAASPWLIPFAALLICKEILSLVELTVDHRHAVVMQALWRMGCAEKREPAERVLSHTNDLLHHSGEHKMDDIELAEVLEHLKQLRCLQMVDNTVQLEEYVMSA